MSKDAVFVQNRSRIARITAVFAEIEIIFMTPSASIYVFFYMLEFSIHFLNFDPHPSALTLMFTIILQWLSILYTMDISHAEYLQNEQLFLFLAV